MGKKFEKPADQAGLKWTKMEIVKMQRQVLTQPMLLAMFAKQKRQKTDITEIPKIDDTAVVAGEKFLIAPSVDSEKDGIDLVEEEAKDFVLNHVLMNELPKIKKTAM